MDHVPIIPGRRVEIDGLGEGTVVGRKGDGGVEIALSEIETVVEDESRIVPEGDE